MKHSWIKWAHPQAHFLADYSKESGKRWDITPGREIRRPSMCLFKR
jgi:hypothetical protein